MPLEVVARRLGVPVTPSRGDMRFANIDIDHEGDWSDVIVQLEAMGPSITALRNEGAINAVILDVAYDLPDGVVAISRTVPAPACSLAGQFGIDIMVSIYRTSEN